ncbi:hypothetical protein B0T17DRAFT_61051 [Bombardia bombarda]|uniref:Uncharacterized protein n=1 Tax=Bombardia bombarda TaxID=252184 RepID=A0AA40CEJ5_9PEZI|nr:hypothetical protein B0T17DRAFT_61051 [Bombardia bombarda]
MTRSHKFNDKDHAGIADGTVSPQEHVPKFFAKSGFADVDPKKTKKNGGGKGNCPLTSPMPAAAPTAAPSRPIPRCSRPSSSSTSPSPSSRRVCTAPLPVSLRTHQRSCTRWTRRRRAAAVLTRAATRR